MARLRVIARFGLFAAFLSGSGLACSPEIKEGYFSCESSTDCPSDWYCWSNGLCYETAETNGGQDAALPNGDGGEPRDASPSDAVPTDSRPTDANPMDALPTDARADTGVAGDGGGDEDAGPSDVPDAGCVDNVGDLCNLTGRCGARVSCEGQCVGGLAEPNCSCGISSCDGDGNWTACPDPVDLGQTCSDMTTCAGTIDCSGLCSGGAARPPCNCGTATCDGTGWSCPDPPNFGQTCDGMTNCNGTIDCRGECIGGSALPNCECGTPTCGGCVGGTCGANSFCQNGSCVCNNQACTCPGAGSSGCDVCLGNGNIGQCTLDVYECGAVGPLQQTCTFGCTAGPPPLCACSPETGNSCFTEQCSCNCGTIPNFGQTECDGSCTPSYPNCFQLCQDICGGFCPFPPCPI